MRDASDDERGVPHCVGTQEYGVRCVRACLCACMCISNLLDLCDCVAVLERCSHQVRTCSIGSSSINPPSLLSSKTRIPSDEQHSCTSTALRLRALILGNAVEMTSAPNKFHMALLSLAAATGTEPRYLHLPRWTTIECSLVGQALCWQRVIVGALDAQGVRTHTPHTPQYLAAYTCHAHASYHVNTSAFLLSTSLPFSGSRS